MNNILETKSLTKQYLNTTVVDNINMKIEKGSICGLIGKNGAGKTTIMKMIVGLAKQTDGKIKLFGSEDLNQGRKKIGTIIENPAVYGNLSARENLKIVCKVFGITDLDRIDYILDLVGLSNTGKKKAKSFSLGMKQRLGLAIALISEPEFLVLDEPINGLDPAGVCEIRDLILKLNKEKGITFLISSHILGELEKISTDYMIIKDGKIIDEFKRSELKERCKKFIKIESDETEHIIDILENKLNTKNYKLLDNCIELYDYIEAPEEVNAALVKENIKIKSLCIAGEDLEGYFLDLIGGKKN